MTRTKFTVVTPVFNGARYIAETIASVQAQDYPYWQYFIMDGGSTDDTVAIAEAFVKSDQRLSLVQEPDEGMYDAIFKGLVRDDGEICCWINSDDKLAPWAFSTVVDTFAETGADWVTGLPAIWDQAGRMCYVVPRAWYPQRLIKRGWFHMRGLGTIQQESTFFTRRLLEKLSADAVRRIRTSAYAGDYLLWREFARYSPLLALPIVLSGFRVHGSNLSFLHLDGYTQEVRQFGGPVPPRYIVLPLKALFISLAIFQTMRATRKRRNRLLRSQRQTTAQA